MKPFLSYDQQLDKLIDKNLVIDDEDTVKEQLMYKSYFSLIGGYKSPFRDPSTRKYINDSTFNDILALYNFDEELRTLFFHYICTSEITIRSKLSYSFCELHGNDQGEYLNYRNYNSNSSNNNAIRYLIRTLEYEAIENNKHEYVLHQRNRYSNVPLWVLVHTLTFGKLSKLYEFSTSQIRSSVASGFPGISDRDLEKMLKNLVLYRNVCGHHERLYSHKVYTDFPDTVLHEKLQIPKKGNQYIYGKRDLFGVVISLRYLLHNEDFKAFKHQLTKIINNFLKSTPTVPKDWLYSEMGFPENWIKITSYKKY